MVLKRSDIQVFVIAHKKTQVIENSIFTPLQVGYSDENFFDLRDNTGVNISHLNNIMSECSGIFWIWKNICSDIRLKYVGQVTYRRLWDIDESFDVDEIFKEYDIMINEPVKLYGNGALISVYENYDMYHDISDLDFVLEVIKRDYPEMYDHTYNIFHNTSEVYASNGFIMRKEDYCDYCNFMFPIIMEYANKNGMSSVESTRRYCEEKFEQGVYKLFGKNEKTHALFYQIRILGFIAERLLTIYVTYKFNKKYILKYKEGEKII